MFHSTNVFYLDIFASLLTNKIYNMKKLMSIFGVILFTFALTSCCDGFVWGNDCAEECCTANAEAPETPEAPEGTIETTIEEAEEAIEEAIEAIEEATDDGWDDDW